MTDGIGGNEKELLVEAVFLAEIYQKIEGSIHSNWPGPSDVPGFPLLIDESPLDQ